MSDPGQSPIAPTDLNALLRHVTRLSDDLEKVWSNALEPAALAAATDGLGLRLKVMLTALAARHQSRDAELDATGIDVRLPDWPPSPQHVLAADPSDAAGRWHLAMIGQLQAFEGLVTAANALVEPSGVATDMPSGRELRRWWESGAFALLASRARLVERLTRAVACAEAELLGQDAAPSRDARYEVFDAAMIAYRRGDPEAALLHAIRAARLTIGREDGWATLRALPDRAVLADLLDRAQTAITAHMLAEPAAETQPLASVLLPRLQRLIYDAPPEA